MDSNQSGPAAPAGAKPGKKRIALLRLSALGDCINAFGFIGGLQRAYPKFKLTWIIEERFAPLFYDHDKDPLVPMIEVPLKKQGLKALLQLKKELKQQHFDYLFDLQTSFKASLTAACIPAKVKYGYDKERAREGQTLFTDVKVPSPESPHVLAGFLAFAKAAGLGEIEPYWDFALQDNERDYAKSYFDSDRIFLIAPASAKAQKNWTVEGYAEIGRYAHEHGFTVGLLGGSARYEAALCSAIEKELKVPCVNLCGRTSLRELLAVVSVGSLLLAPDSGTMHLASALHTPVIGLFAVHNEQRGGPWNFPDLCVSVYHELAAKELGERAVPWRYRVRAEDAMTRITPDMVKAKFDYAAANYGVNKHNE